MEGLNPIEVKVAVTYYNSDGSTSNDSSTERIHEHYDNLTDEDAPARSSCEDIRKLQPLKRRNAVVIGSNDDMENFYIYYKGNHCFDRQDDDLWSGSPTSQDNKLDPVPDQDCIAYGFSSPEIKRMKTVRDICPNLPGQGSYRRIEDDDELSLFRMRASKNSHQCHTNSVERTNNPSEHKSGCGAGCIVS